MSHTKPALPETIHARKLASNLICPAPSTKSASEGQDVGYFLGLKTPHQQTKSNVSNCFLYIVERVIFLGLLRSVVQGNTKKTLIHITVEHTPDDTHPGIDFGAEIWSRMWGGEHVQ